MLLLANVQEEQLSASPTGREFNWSVAESGFGRRTKCRTVRNTTRKIRVTAQKLKQMLNDTAHHARLDVCKVNDRKAEALFETTAEALKGLVKAFTDFGEKKEEAWKTAGTR